MTTYILRRTEQTDAATFGELVTEDGWKIALTLEEPWRRNMRNVSCIPAGTYEMFKRLSPKRGYTLWELRGVPNRDNVQIHVGNWLSDTEGCILVGTQHSDRIDTPSIAGSKLAFRLWMAATVEDEEALLEVVDP